MLRCAESYRYLFTPSEALTSPEIEQMYALHVACFPPFREYYERNRFYSVVKPQAVLRVFDDAQLVATGKFLWRELMLEGIGTVKFIIVGVLIDAAYRGAGVGKHMLCLLTAHAHTHHGDVLYGSTQHPLAATKAAAYGFYIPACPVQYTHGITQEIVDVKTSGYTPYFLDLRAGLRAKIDAVPLLHLGTGPL